MTSKRDPTPHRENYSDGTAKMTGFHLDGQMHGDWVFNRRDGSVMRTGAFDRGRQVGTWRTHDRSGRVVKETTFPTRDPGFTGR